MIQKLQKLHDKECIAHHLKNESYYCLSFNCFNFSKDKVKKNTIAVLHWIYANHFS